MEDSVISSYKTKAEELEEYRNGGTLPAHEAELDTLYMDVCGKHIRECNCKDRWSDALIEIHVTLNKLEKMTMAGTKYRLRVGVVLHDFEKNEAYTNANLTDKIAKDYLKRYPQQADLFEVLPEAKKVSKQEESQDAAVEEELKDTEQEESQDAAVEEAKKVSKQEESQDADSNVEDTEQED
jgi:hypothetical protein